LVYFRGRPISTLKKTGLGKGGKGGKAPDELRRAGKKGDQSSAEEKKRGGYFPRWTHMPRANEEKEKRGRDILVLPQERKREKG